jgi:hypothetical protein
MEMMRFLVLGGEHRQARQWWPSQYPIMTTPTEAIFGYLSAGHYADPTGETGPYRQGGTPCVTTRRQAGADSEH